MKQLLSLPSILSLYIYRCYINVTRSVLVLPQHRTRHQAGATLMPSSFISLKVYKTIYLEFSNVDIKECVLQASTFSRVISGISEAILDFVVVNRSTMRWNLVLGCWRCLIDGNVKCYIINGRLIYKRPKLYWDIALLLKNIKKKQNKNFHKFSI